MSRKKITKIEILRKKANKATEKEKIIASKNKGLKNKIKRTKELVLDGLVKVNYFQSLCSQLKGPREKKRMARLLSRVIKFEKKILAK